MSSLLARIMLAMLMLPLGAIVYLLTTLLVMEWVGYSNDVTAFMLANLLASAFVGVYWTLLWRRSIRWDSTRILATAAALIAAAVLGLLVGALGTPVDDSFGAFIGGSTWILCGLTFVTFAWRDRPAERADRVLAASTSGAVCPTCGYNMTGLREPACPECGARFTLEQFAALQPLREQEELKSDAANRDR